jgi:hypothetical protein
LNIVSPSLTLEILKLAGFVEPPLSKVNVPPVAEELTAKEKDTTPLDTPLISCPL